MSTDERAKFLAEWGHTVLPELLPDAWMEAPARPDLSNLMEEGVLYLRVGKQLAQLMLVTSIQTEREVHWIDFQTIGGGVQQKFKGAQIETVRFEGTSLNEDLLNKIHNSVYSARRSIQASVFAFRLEKSAVTEFEGIVQYVETDFSAESRLAQTSVGINVSKVTQIVCPRP